MINDIWSAITRGFMQLDEDEAAVFGAPDGETISLFAAMQQRHGSAVAHIVCLGLWLVQFHHCRDQITNLPMRWDNYARAAVLLVLVMPVVGAVAIARRF